MTPLQYVLTYLAIAITCRVHGRYERTLSNLSWAEQRVTLQFDVSKSVCLNSACKRRIFTERVPQIIESWARRTCRLAQYLQALALSLGGNAGIRLDRQWGTPSAAIPSYGLLASLSIPYGSIARF